MQRPQLVSKGTLNRVLQAAEQAWHRRDFEENIALLERASRLDSANAAIWLQLGRMHGLLWNYSSAESCFERAIRLTPSNPDILTKIGIQCRDFNESLLAENYFKRAAEQKSVSAESLAHLAELYERLRKLPEAIETLDRAIKLNPHCSLALLVKAKLKRQSGELEEGKELLHSFLTKSDHESQIRGYYELGTILNQEGQFREAMDAFVKAKTLIRLEARPFQAELSIVRQRLSQMRKNISKAQIQKWLDNIQNLAPLRRIALLCGHPRSGTTLLEQVLDSSPQIFSAEETEIFHDYAYIPLTRNAPEGSSMLTVLEAAEPSLLNQSRSSYLQRMKKLLGSSIQNGLLLDKNPSLTFLIPALIRVFPEIKLLVALRDPRDVCLSCFMQPFYPIGRTTSAYLTLESTIAEYGELMSNWIALKPQLTNFKEVRYEDMVENLEQAARAATDFLDIEWDETMLKFNEHARRKVVRSPTYGDVTKPIFKTGVGRWRNYSEYFEPHMDQLAPFIEAFHYNL